MDLETARKQVDIPLPDSATEIFYGYYSEWMAYDFILRFKAPLETCKAHASILLKHHNKTSPENLVSEKLQEMTEIPEQISFTGFSNVTWFDIHNIKDGFIAGEFGSHQPRIWIDKTKNILYYRYTD